MKKTNLQVNLIKETFSGGRQGELESGTWH